jgi:DNA repair exonuclease SbcCD nuclease subunit
MPNFQFIHAADLHLGAPFAGLHQENPAVAHIADKATYDAFENIIGLAIERNALFVLFCGDIFDAEYPNLEAQLRFRDGICRLDAAGISSCVIRGNHDHGGSRRANLEFPDRYFEFAPGFHEPHHIHQNGVPVVAIHGYSYPQRAVTENILRHYVTRAEDESCFRIGMLHGNVGGDAMHDNYAPCSVSQLKEIDIDYWALGHVHQARVLSSNAPAIAYSGSPQGLSPRETGAHGCYLVTVEDRRSELEFIETDSLRWAYLHCDISEIADMDGLMEALEDLLQTHSERENCALMVCIALTGRGELHQELQERRSLETLRERLNEQVNTAFPVWVDRLQDATQPDIDLEKKRQENDILGDYLRLCTQVQNDAQLQDKLRAALSDVCGHAEVRSALGLRGSAQAAQWLEQQLPQWIGQAEINGADLLLEEEGL